MNSLPLGGMLGLLVMILLGAIQWNEIDEVVENGFKMMTLIAFVMLVAAGHANVLKASLTLWR